MGIVQVYLGKDIEADAAAAAAQAGLSVAKWLAQLARHGLGAGVAMGPGRPETTTGDILARLKQGPATVNDLADASGRRVPTVEEKLRNLIAVGKVIQHEKAALVTIKSGQKLPKRVIYYGLPGAFDLDTQHQP